MEKKNPISRRCTPARARTEGAVKAWGSMLETMLSSIRETAGSTVFGIGASYFNYKLYIVTAMIGLGTSKDSVPPLRRQFRSVPLSALNLRKNRTIFLHQGDMMKKLLLIWTITFSLSGCLVFGHWRDRDHPRDDQHHGQQEDRHDDQHNDYH